MALLRAIGFCFLLLVAPLGAFLASYSQLVADALSQLLGTAVSRGQLGLAFMLLTALCLRIDLGVRRRYQQRQALVSS